MSAHPYRTLASAPARPALTFWQRALVATLGERCAAFRWYRAHVGGWWMRGASPGTDGPRWYLASRWPEMHAAVSGIHATHASCEVYPHAVEGAGPCPVAPAPPRAPGWHVISRPGAAILVEEHVLTAEARAALDIGRRGLR